nr:uncharacterized protein LOC111421721 [Onthophagus taurus]
MSKSGDREKDSESVFERQNDLFGSISRTITNIKKLALPKRTVGIVQARLEGLAECWEEFKTNHLFLLQYRTTLSETVYFKEDVFTSCEEAYIEAKGAIFEFLRELETPASPSPPPANVSTDTSTTLQPRQLPRISLPVFNGAYAEWAQFRDLFVTMVSKNPNLSGVEQFQYLKISLVDEPAQLVKNLSITNDNFDRAWKLLVHCYENLRILVDTQVARLFNTKSIKNESASELSRLIAEIEEALAALESLGCDIKHWDPLLVYLVVKKLDQDSMKD